KRIPTSLRKTGEQRTHYGNREAFHSYRFGQASWAGTVLLFADYCGVVPSRVSARSTGRADVPPRGLDQNAGGRIFFHSGYHFGPGLDGDPDSRQTAAGEGQPDLPLHSGNLPPDPQILPALPMADHRCECDLPDRHFPACVEAGEPVHASIV